MSWRTGANRLQYQGFTDLIAQNGNTGNLLLDPATWVIANSGGDITPADVENALLTANVTYDATDFLTVSDGINSSSGNNLTLDAPTINLNASISLTGQLMGTANTVNVGTLGWVQNGVDVAANGATVNLAAGEFIDPTTIEINKSLTLMGAGAENTTVSGNNAFQVLNISGGDVTLDGLMIANGRAEFGAGIEYRGTGTLTITNITFSGNHAIGGDGGDGIDSGGGGGGGAGLGGGIFFDGGGTVTVSNSTFIGNQAMGGKGGNGDGNFDGFGNGGMGGGSFGGMGGNGSDGGNGEFGGGGGGGSGNGGLSFGNLPNNGGGFGGGDGGGNVSGFQTGSEPATYLGSGNGGGQGGFGGGGGGMGGGQGGFIFGGGGEGGSGGGGGGGLGGAIFVNSGSISVRDSTFTNNNAERGTGGTGDFDIRLFWI